jgi:diguanylate cyclase (GGDEF)-like protein/PAS domain S-box-containing protein
VATLAGIASAVLDASDDLIVTTSLDGTVLSWNPAAERLVGWTASETIGRSIKRIVPEDRREDEVAMIMSTVARGGTVDHLDTLRLNKDGSLSHMSLTVSPIRDETGQVIGTCGIARDISAQQRSERAEAQLASIVNSVEDAILSVDVDGRVTSWNRGAEHLYGYTAAEMVGRHYGEILEGEALEDFKRTFAKTLAGDRVGDHETSRPRRDGTMMDVSMCVAPILGSNGSLVGASAILHDITSLKERERELATSKALLERAQRIGHLGGWNCRVEPNPRLVCTDELFRIFGTAPRPTLAVEDFFARVHPDDLARVQGAVFSSLSVPGHAEIELRILRPDGVQRWVAASSDTIADENGNPVEVEGIMQDITDRREAEEEAKGVESHLRMFAENSRDLIFRYRFFPKPGFEFVSPACLSITGYTPDELYAHPELLDRVIEPPTRAAMILRRPGDDRSKTIDIEIQRKDGTKCWVSQQLEAVYGPLGDVIAVEGIVRDIGERKAAEQRLEHEVLHDPLTGLPNRVLVRDRIEQALSRSVRDPGLVAVLLIDLDRFKIINDARDHAWGDAVLMAIAERLTKGSRAEDTVGRLVGDEFVVVCEKSQSLSDAIKIADHTLALFDEPFEVEGEKVHVAASIGIATGTSTDDADALLRDADLAMYRAKDRGRNRYEVFGEALQAEFERRNSAETGLQRALDNHEFCLVYQPVWSMTDKRFVGAEALLRWIDPDRGTVGPDEFIPVAEECGLIVPMGEWVLKEACGALARWSKMGGKTAAYTMSVNVSAVQLRSRDFVHAVQEAIRTTRIDPHLLCLEITESVLMEDVEHCSEVLRKLQAIGTRLSIDDFGTGYSSLAYLRRFPVNELKIDRSFITNLDSDPYDATLVSAVIAIGSALGLRVVAEGVETDGELGAVQDLGCHFIQGFFFARPCSFDECTRLLSGKLSK